jgi:hypothetical protein
MLIRKDKSCLCCLWMWWSWCVTVTQQWHGNNDPHNFKRGLSMCKSGDWFCLSCMDYGLPEAVIYYYYYYYYYYFKFSYFWPKIWEIFLFQLCIHLTNFLSENWKKKNNNSWVLKFVKQILSKLGCVLVFKESSFNVAKHVWPLGPSSFMVYSCEEGFLISC